MQSPASKFVALKMSAGMLCLVLAGCASKPRIYHSPESAAVVESGKRLGDAVAAAVQTSERERVYFSVAKKGAADVGARLTTLATKLDVLFQNAPVELKPLVEEIRGEMERARQELSATEDALEEVQDWQKTLLTQLEDAVRARDAHAFEQAAFIARADQLAASATAENAVRVKAEAELRAIKSRGWVYKILTGLGILGAVAITLLLCLGKLAGALSFR